MNAPTATLPPAAPRSLIHGVILGAFCLGFGIALALTYRATADDIAARAREDKQASLAQVLPPTLFDNSPATDVVVLKDAAGREVPVHRARKAGQVTAAAFEASGRGYAGEIRLVMGVATDGRVLGVRVLAHKETPGLGDKIEARKGDWILRFDGLSLDKPPADRWKVKKDGGDFDQFAGATITPRAVVGAIRDGLEFFAAHRAAILEGR